MKNLIVIIALILGISANSQTDRDVLRLEYLNEVNVHSNVKSSFTMYTFTDDTLVEIMHITDFGSKKFQAEMEPLLSTEGVVDGLATNVINKLRNTRVIYHDLKDLRLRFYKLICVDNDNNMYHSIVFRL